LSIFCSRGTPPILTSLAFPQEALKGSAPIGRSWTGRLTIKLANKKGGNPRGEDVPIWVRGFSKRVTLRLVRVGRGAGGGGVAVFAADLKVMNNLRILLYLVIYDSG